MKFKKIIFPALVGAAVLGTAIAVGTSHSVVYAADTTTTTKVEVNEWEEKLKNTKSNIDYQNFRIDFDYLTSEEGYEEISEYIADNEMGSYDLVLSNGNNNLIIRYNDDNLLIYDSYVKYMSGDPIYDFLNEFKLDSYEEYFNIEYHEVFMNVSLDNFYVSSNYDLDVLAASQDNIEDRLKLMMQVDGFVRSLDDNLYDIYGFSYNETLDEEFLDLIPEINEDTYNKILAIEGLHEKFMNNFEWHEYAKQYYEDNELAIIASLLSVVAFTALGFGIAGYVKKSKRRYY